MSLPLTLEPLSTPRTYELKTTSVMRMNQAAEQNTYHTVARQTLLERKPNHTYRLKLEVLSFRVEKPTFFHQLAADLNQVSNSLVIQTDLYGRLERIENKGDLLRTWQRIKPDVVRKYRDHYPKAFFEAFGQNLQAEGVFEKSLRHKGLHGVLLSGLYGYGYVPEAPIPGTRVLEQFINQVSLPLQTTTRHAPEPATPGHLELEVEGHLHEAAFRDDDLRRLFRAMADNPLLRVDLQATCQERYELDAAGWLVKARQHLRAEVPGIYLNEVEHELQTVS